MPVIFKKFPNLIRLNKKLLLVIVATAAVLCIPLLYSAVYLGSVWDTYGHIDQVPVALVNLDQPACQDGKTYSIGQDLVANLQDNAKVAWKLVSHEKAFQGVQGSDYYAMVEIPIDFSAKVAAAGAGTLVSPDIVYIVNKGKNFVFGQVSDRLAEGIKSEINTGIQSEITKAMAESMYDIEISLKDAGAGAGTLQEGTARLLAGSQDLSKGLKTATTGSGQLDSGLQSAVKGTNALQDGLNQLGNGSTDLAAGLKKAVQGSAKLQDGLSNAVTGEQQVLDGMANLTAGLTVFKAAMNASDTQIPRLVQGASDLNANTAQLAVGAEELDYALKTGLSQAASGIAASNNGIHSVAADLNNKITVINASNLSDADKGEMIKAIMTLSAIDQANTQADIPSALNSAASSATPLVDALKKLQEGTSQVSDGLSALASGLADKQAQAVAGIDKLVEGASALQSGTLELKTGLTTAADKMDELTQGLQTLHNGVDQLADGIQDVKTGNSELATGLQTAETHMNDLTSGLNKLQHGASRLSTGLDQANDGVLDLHNGLKSGYDQLENKLVYSPEDLANYVESPVKLENEPLNPVNFYGQGFAPYFISLSLWLGAMFVSLLLQIINSKFVFKNRFTNRFSVKLVSGLLLTSLQSVLVSFVLLRFPGVSPISVPGFYLANLFIACVFFAFMQGFSNAIGVLSVPILFVVFILQLASSGGTFPIETAPVFYQSINPFMPMTYSVRLLRMVVSGFIPIQLRQTALKLLAMALISLSVGGTVQLVSWCLVRLKSQRIARRTTH